MQGASPLGIAARTLVIGREIELFSAVVDSQVSKNRHLHRAAPGRVSPAKWARWGSTAAHGSRAAGQLTSSCRSAGQGSARP